jgi:type IV pilus assembly protein PilO
MALLPSTQRDQILLVACIALLGGAYAFYEYVWSPKTEQLDQVQQRVDTLQAQNEIARREIASGKAAQLRAEAEQYGRMLVIMRQLVPVANEVPTLLDQVSTAARRSGLDIGDVTPLGVIPGDIFDTYRYRIGVSGPYHRIAQFLNNIGSLTRIIAPMNLSMAPTSRQNARVRAGERLLDASFEIQTYVAKTAPPPVAQTPTSGAPTSGAGGQ